MLKLSLLSLAVAFCGAVGLDDQSRLRQITDNIRQNEALYDDLEVVWEFRYRKLNPKRPDPRMIISSEAGGRSVSQGRFFYVDIEGENLDFDGQQRSIARRRGFDGATTRLVERKALANVIKGREEDSQAFHPHRIPFRREFMMVPLSTYVRGAEAIKAHPSGHVDAGVIMRVSYKGEDEVAGLMCQKIGIERLLETEGGPVKSGENVVWLAQERNFLPVKTDGYYFRASVDLPISECVLSDLREIDPGVWFPFHAVLTVYDEVSLREDNAVMLAWQDEYEIEKVSLHPNYDISLFRDIEIPRGIPVYGVEHGDEGQKVVRGTVVAEPQNALPAAALPAGTSGRGALFWTAMSLAAILTVGVTALLLILSRSRKPTA